MMSVNALSQTGASGMAQPITRGIIGGLAKDMIAAAVVQVLRSRG